MLAEEETYIAGTRDRVKTGFAVIFTAGMVFGVPANLLALHFFCRRASSTASNKRYMTLLYRVIILVDTFICLLVLPLVESSWRSGPTEDDRKRRSGAKDDNTLTQTEKDDEHSLPVLFGEPTFCTIWGLLWNVLSVLSVYLVGILSFSRCQLLLRPLSTLNIFKPALLLSVLTVFIVIEKLVAHFSSSSLYDDVKYGFYKNMRVCYILSGSAGSDYDLVQSVMFTVLLGLPVLPIIGSFVVSVYKLQEAHKREKKLKSGETSKHREATITVILITGMYILCNTPVLVFYMYVWMGGNTCFFKSLSRLDEEDVCRNTDAKTKLVMSLVWVASYTLLVLINSSLNPVVYFTRITELRESLGKQRDVLLRRFRRGDSGVGEGGGEEVRDTKDENI